MAFRHYKRNIFVYASCCNEKINEEEIMEFINISEDFQGRDILTYKCPLCDEIHKSLRVGG